MFMLIQRGAATTVTSLLYLVPPTTALMAWLLFDEAITAVTVFGIVLTAIGVSLVVRPAKA
jgi:drug/metabolite transporter (DMT)-like permease